MYKSPPAGHSRVSPHLPSQVVVGCEGTSQEGVTEEEQATETKASRSLRSPLSGKFDLLSSQVKVSRGRPTEALSLMSVWVGKYSADALTALCQCVGCLISSSSDDCSGPH